MRHRRPLYWRSKKSKTAIQGPGMDGQPPRYTRLSLLPRTRIEACLSGQVWSLTPRLLPFRALQVDIFRVSLKDELPKPSALAASTPLLGPQAVVDPVRQSIEAISRATEEAAALPTRPATAAAPASQRRQGDPLRRSLTSTYLRRMVDEVDAEVNSKIREAPAPAAPSPTPAAALSDGDAAKTPPISNGDAAKTPPVSPEKPRSQLNHSTLAEEREALKQRKRLEALNKSAAKLPAPVVPPASDPEALSVPPTATQAQGVGA